MHSMDEVELVVVQLLPATEMGADVAPATEDVVVDVVDVVDTVLVVFSATATAVSIACT